MSSERKGDTRQRLISAAAELVSASPGRDVPLREICDRVGVKLPTLYHFFGSKQGLIDAVVRDGFANYLAIKGSHSAQEDPVQALRSGWDDHVAFGRENPGFYALMYGRVQPGERPAAAGAPHAMLLELTRAAASQGRLSLSPELAADHVLAANVGVTLYLITSPEPEERLSAAVREATLAAITASAHTRGQPGLSPADDFVRLPVAVGGPDDDASGLGARPVSPDRSGRDVPAAAAALLAALRDGGRKADASLGWPELALLEKWLGVIADVE